MFELLRRVLNYEFTVTQLTGFGLMLATPYLLIGLIWSGTLGAALRGLAGLDLAVSLLGSIVLWPVLLASNLCPG